MYIEDVYDDWGLGVVTSLLPDAIPSTASPEGMNSRLIYAAAGKAIPASRLGLLTRNRTAVTGSPALIGMYGYKQRSGTIRHLLVSDTGRIDLLNSDDTLTNISTSLTAGTYYPSFATANDMCFIVNGQDKVKLVGATPRTFGLTAPAAPTLAVGAGAMTGTYEVALTYSVSTTGAESSISDAASLVVAAQGIDVSWSAPADAQVTHVNVYLRKPVLGIKFFKVATIAVGTTTTTLDVSDTAYTALILVGPDTSENNPPPAGIKYLAWHRSRLFAADDANVYYSKVALPEAYDPDAYEAINPDDGQPITGLLSYDDVLIIFKRDSTWMLVGDDPVTWSVQLVDGAVGCTSHRSIWQLDQIAGWWSEYGPVIMEGRSITPIGKTMIAPSISPTVLNTSMLNAVAAAVDVEDQRIIYLVATSGSSRLDRWLPYNHRLKVWEASEGWNPMDAASIAVVEDSTSRPLVYIGNYGGQVFRVGTGYNDGVVTGTANGGGFTGVTSISTLTIPGISITFDTTGAGLVERYVTVVGANGIFVARRRITANTSTALTLASAITGLTASTTYTFYVGGIDFRWSTKWSDFGHPFEKKRFYYLEVQVTGTTPSLVINADMAYEYDTSVGQTDLFTLTSGAASAAWGSAIWDTSVWGTEGVAQNRMRIGRTGRAYKVRIRHLGNEAAFELRKIRVSADMWKSRR